MWEPGRGVRLSIFPSSLARKIKKKKAQYKAFYKQKVAQEARHFFSCRWQILTPISQVQWCGPGPPRMPHTNNPLMNGHSSCLKSTPVSFPCTELLGASHSAWSPQWLWTRRRPSQKEIEPRLWHSTFGLFLLVDLWCSFQIPCVSA